MAGLRRAVIVNADDFGQSAEINRGIIEAHERGIVTSASLMVHRAGAVAAAAYARAHPRLSVGLHVDVGEWRFRDGAWHTVYERVDRTDARRLEAEIRAQLSICRHFLRRDPTHLDSHQHVHNEEPARSILDRVAGELGVPLRHRTPDIRYEGGFFGQTHRGEPLHANISTSGLMELLRNLPEGVTELACHPGYADGHDGTYSVERGMELQALCDPDVRRVLREEEIELITFTDVVAASSRPAQSEGSVSSATQSDTDLRREVAQVDWFHIMDLGEGVTTPGLVVCMSPEQLGLGRLDGLTVLDVGAWDGAYSFMAERYGASRVLATDFVVWSGAWRTAKAGFNLARRVLNSKVEDMTIDVMELSPSKPGVFDVVLFLGVLYHLRHPLLALERIFSVVGKQLILETHIDLADYARPAMVFYPDTELAGDPTNWWGPNPAAVEAMLKSVGFREVKTVSIFRPSPGVAQWWSPNDPAAVKEQGRAIFHAWK